MQSGLSTLPEDLESSSAGSDSSRPPDQAQGSQSHHFVQTYPAHIATSNPTSIAMPDFALENRKTSGSALPDNAQNSDYGMSQTFQAASTQTQPHSYSNIMPTAPTQGQQAIFIPDFNAMSLISPTDSSLGPPPIDININSPITPGSNNGSTDISLAPSFTNNQFHQQPISQNPNFMSTQGLPSLPQGSSDNGATAAQIQIPSPSHHDRNQSLPNGSTQQYDKAYNHRVSLNRAATVAETSRPNSRISNVPMPTINLPDSTSFQFPPQVQNQPSPQPGQISVSTQQHILPGNPNPTNLLQDFQFPAVGQFPQQPQSQQPFQLQPPPISGSSAFQFPQQQQFTIPDSSTLSPISPIETGPGDFGITIPDLGALDAGPGIVIPDVSNTIPQTNTHFPQTPKDVRSSYDLAASSSQIQSQNISPTSNADNTQSKPSDLKNLSEYALHILFTQFVRFAEKKLNLCLTYTGEGEPPVEELLAVGADSSLDQAISLLGDTAKWKPKMVIDSVMSWRKTKSEAFAKASYDLAQFMAFQAKTNPKAVGDPKYIQKVTSLRQAEIHAERKSLISIFILCRVLMVIVKKTPTEVLGDDLSGKLEEIVFKQLKAVDPNILATSSIRAANWNLFSELLGEMSQERFARVGDEFIAELEKYKGMVPKEKELNVQLVIHGMKHLKIKLYPMDSLEDSSEFLLSLSKFFTNIQNPTIKIAYSQIFCDLLLPVAEVASAEFNYPTWENAMSSLYNRAEELLARPKYWLYAFPLATTILSVSPPEAFSKHFNTIFDTHISKYKEKPLRHVFLTCASRLVWVYLFRCPDSLNNTTKRLESACKPLIGNGTKRFWTTMEPPSAASLAYFIRVVGFGHLTFTLENIFFQLIFPNSQPSDFVTISLDNVYAERTIIAIRSFIYTLNDYETNHRPEFPTDEAVQKLATELPTKTTAKPVKAYSITLSEFKEQFCKLIGRFLLICDTHFGYNISITDEKQTTQNVSFKSQIPSFHFGNNKEHMSPAAQRQIYMDLFCILLEAIPWCYPTTIASTRMLELLCRNSAHPDANVSTTASKILKNLIVIRDPITIIPVVTKFIFSLDSKVYSNSNTSQSSYNDFKSLIVLYIQLLETWKGQLVSSKKQQQESKQQPAWPPWGHNDGNGNGTEDSDSTKRSDERRLNSIWNIIEEAEGNGLFFLCSQDREIRQSAIKILRIAQEFDNLLNEDEKKKKDTHKQSDSYSSNGNTNDFNSKSVDGASTTSSTSGRSKKEEDGEEGCSTLFSRIISFFETTEPLTLYKSVPFRLNLSAPERRRIHKLHGKHTGGLVYIAESDYGVDTAIWIKMFPLVMRACFERFPIAVALCRNIVCGKLVQMHETVLELSRIPGLAGPGSSVFPLKHTMRTHADVVVEQWRMYLIVASTTLTQTEEQKLHVPNNQFNHGRKKSVQKVTIHHQKITSARSVFRMVIPLFDQEHPIIRDAVVTSLAWVNINIYKTLIFCLEPALSTWKEEFAFYLSQPRKDSYIWHKVVRVATEIFHVLSSTAYFLKDPRIYDDSWVLTKLLTFLNEMKSFFLSRPDVQIDPNCNRLRVFFTALLEAVYLGVCQSSMSSKLFSFEMRVNYFFFIEEWCGVGRTESISEQREYAMKKKLMEQNFTRDEERLALVGFEIEKNSLEKQTLSAMSSLCSGLISNDSDSDNSPHLAGFNLTDLLVWIDATYQSNKEYCIELGNRALKNLLTANPDEIFVFKEAIANCYKKQSDDPISRSYFLTVGEALLQLDEYPCKVWQVLSLGLFKCGDSSVEVRSLALKLLKSVEKKFYETSCVHEYEVSLVNNTPAVYKRAMFNLSSRFALEHPEETFMVFSEMTMFFHQVDDFSRRDILAVLLPWIQTVELQLEPDGITPDPEATMVVNNLFEITVIFSPKIQNEVEALWVSIGNGKYPGNVKIVLDFIIHHCLERRSPGFVEHVRKILVYLSSTAVGTSLIDDLISYIRPKCMVPQKPVPHDISIAASQFPYVSNISTLLDPQEKEVNFSEGQLAIIFLADILNDRREYLKSNMPLILHICYVLMDHYTHIVNTQAREMLITVVYSLASDTQKADELVDLLRKKDSQSTWSYYELTSDKMGARTPDGMKNTIHDVLEIFAEDNPDLREQWARMALSWATTCSVRHIACRSFQILRCLITFLDPGMLGDMLARLSNTIADEKPDIQGFAMQILVTFSSIISELTSTELLNIPQLFWATVACLGTTNEQEFIESIAILDAYISKIDLNDQENIDRLINIFPQSQWYGNFTGLQSLLLGGLRSSVAYEPTLRMICKLSYIRNSEIVGENRLYSTILANLPRFMHSLETGDMTSEIIQSADQLTQICTQENRMGLARIFTSLSKNRFRSKKDFVNQCSSAISSNFFPSNTKPALTLLFGLLFNKNAWIKIETMEILENLLPKANLQAKEFVGVGADFISPLLRLLQTEYAEQSLSVLDKAGEIYGSTLDKKVLRMSLGDKTIRKEYEASSTIFGVPEPSGWAVLSPIATSTACRTHVHAVLYTCAVSKDDPVPTAEEFQFHQEAVPNAPHRGYHHENVDSISMPVPGPEGTLSHMYAELSTLDTFFTQTVGPTHARNISATDTEASDATDLVESAPQIYDKKVSVILSRSLARSPSSASFKTSLADSMGNNTVSQSALPQSPTQQLNFQQQQMLQLHNMQQLQQSGTSRQTGAPQSQTPLSASQEPLPNQSDSRYTIGTRFYHHLRRGHASTHSSSLSGNFNPSSFQSPMVSPISNTSLGSVMESNGMAQANSTSDAGFTQAYRVFSEPNSESEENLELYASRSGPFSISHSNYDVDQYSISTATGTYSQQSQALQQQITDLEPQTSSQAMPSPLSSLSQQSDGIPGDVPFDFKQSNTSPVTVGRKSMDNNASTSNSKSVSTGGNGNLFKLESLLRATTLGKGKKKPDKSRKQSVVHRSSFSTTGITSPTLSTGNLNVAVGVNSSSPSSSSSPKLSSLPLQLPRYARDQSSQAHFRPTVTSPKSHSRAGNHIPRTSSSSPNLMSPKKINRQYFGASNSDNGSPQ